MEHVWRLRNPRTTHLCRAWCARTRIGQTGFLCCRRRRRRRRSLLHTTSHAMRNFVSSRNLLRRRHFRGGRSAQKSRVMIYLVLDKLWIIYTKYRVTVINVSYVWALVTPLNCRRRKRLQERMKLCIVCTGVWRGLQRRRRWRRQWRRRCPLLCVRACSLVGLLCQRKFVLLCLIGLQRYVTHPELGKIHFTPLFAGRNGFQYIHYAARLGRRN